MKILITGVGGPTPRSFAISLKKYSKYADYELVGTDINRLSVGLYQKELFDHSYVIPPAREPEQYWNAIEKIIDKHSIDYAIILPELEVLEWSRRAETGNLPCKTLLPDLKLAQLLFDKSQMTNVLAQLGIVPKSIAFDRSLNNYDSIFDELGAPFWVRSTSGTSGLGSLKIENPESLRNWIQINPGVSHFLASEFLPGRNLACKMLYWEGNLVRTACAERVNYIMAKVAPSGITGNTSFGRLLNEPKLIEVAKVAMERMFTYTESKRHGFFTVDFKEGHDGTPFITEVNIRHVAFTQCFAAAGANFPESTMRLLDGDNTMNKDYQMHQFEEGLIFLRDVDILPIIMKESDLLNPIT